MMYTFHKLEIQDIEDVKVGEIVQVDVDGFLQMLGELGVRATIKYDDATQHLVWVEFPVILRGNDE